MRHFCLVHIIANIQFNEYEYNRAKDSKRASERERERLEKNNAEENECGTSRAAVWCSSSVAAPDIIYVYATLENQNIRAYMIIDQLALYIEFSEPE